MSSNTKVYEDKMKSSVEHLGRELGAVRAGRANPAVLDKVSVDYYGAPTPIQQVASVAVLCCAPSARPSWPAMWASLPLMTALPSA